MHSDEDIILWSCGTWCFARDLGDYYYMSDDFERIPADSERWVAFLSRDAWREFAALASYTVIFVVLPVAWTIAVILWQRI